MSDYAADRRLFHVMRQAAWSHDAGTGGFTKLVDGHQVWVSWGQAMDALRLADDGEPVVGVAPMDRECAEVVTAFERVRGLWPSAADVAASLLESARPRWPWAK